jgi:hypothetical protein
MPSITRLFDDVVLGLTDKVRDSASETVLHPVTVAVIPTPHNATAATALNASLAPDRVFL